MNTQMKNTDNWLAIEQESKSVLSPDVIGFIDCCRQEPYFESRLISVLHKVQGHFGYLGKEQLDAVAQLMQIPVAKVTGVATFYHFFRLKPLGKYVINVCLGTACYVKGAQAIVDKIKAELGIDFGETSRDGLFTLMESRCIGTCGLAPVMMINDEVHAKVTADQIPLILQSYIEKELKKD